MAKAATKIGTNALINSVIDSATRSNINNSIANITALSASGFKFTDGYTIIVIKKVIRAIKIIYIIVLAITYDIAI